MAVVQWFSSLGLRINRRCLIAAAMQDTRNRNVALLGTVVDDVALDGEAAKTWREFVAKPARFGMTGEQDDAVYDVVHEAIGDIRAAIARDVQPSLVEIGLGEF